MKKKKQSHEIGLSHLNPITKQRKLMKEYNGMKYIC